MVAREWLAKYSPNCAVNHADRIIGRMEWPGGFLKFETGRGIKRILGNGFIFHRSERNVTWASEHQKFCALSDFSCVPPVSYSPGC
jgi:hypothetical protein